MEVIDGFKVLKSKWYVVGINKNKASIKRIECQCNTKEQAENYCDEFDAIDYKLYKSYPIKRIITKGEKVKTWFDNSEIQKIN